MLASAPYWALDKATAFVPPWNTTTYILDHGLLKQFVRSISWAPGDAGSDWRLLCRVEESGSDGRFASPCVTRLANSDEYSMVFVRSSSNHVELDCRPLEMPNLVIRAEDVVADPATARGKSSSNTPKEPSYPHGAPLSSYIRIQLLLISLSSLLLGHQWSPFPATR